MSHEGTGFVLTLICSCFFTQLPEIEVVSDEVLGKANGAYAIALKEIYLGLAEYQ